MVSDPVVGNARRHGSALIQEVSTAITSYANAVEETRKSRTTQFYVEGTAYDLIYRAQAGTNKTTLAWCFNKATGAFLPVGYPASDPTIDALVTGGVSSVVNIGRYVYIAGNTITPTYTGTDVFGAASNRSKLAVWVRGGAYARTFKVKVTKLDGTKLEASYKTVPSSYQGILNTSDLLTSDPDYQKKVNDRVYAYNSAVTAWIGTASSDITPENIAAKLAAALTALGITGVGVQEGTVTITDATVAEITGDDGGDGTLLRAVGNELTAAELTSTIHWVGKIVKIRPQRSKGDDAYYIKAYAKSDGDTGFAEVAWREAAGFEMQPNTVFALGTVVAGTLYIAGSPAALETLSGIDTPGYSVNAVGDGITAVLPYFFGNTITYLGVFQDRLVIAAGATVLFSRPGDYLNFFRQSVITVIDTDPWEGFALGAEADTIRHSTTYDRDLILFGDAFQFTISGRQALTPKTASIVIATSYKNATDAPPVATGNFIFYGKYAVEPDLEEDPVTTMHQVQSGVIAESPESFEFSQQLSTYIQGRPVEILSITSPNMLLLRTDGERNKLYVYSYLDTPTGSERLTDSWGHWNWNAQLGAIVGMSAYQENIIVYMLREAGSTTYIAAERFVRTASLSKRPYLDSARRADTSPFLAGKSSGMAVAIGAGYPKRLVGTDYANRAAFAAANPEGLYYGFTFDSYFTPTNPYRVDRNGKAILTGRLTLSRVLVSVADTGGLSVEVTTKAGSTVVLDYRGQTVGVPTLIGRQPTKTTQVGATIGKEIRECTYTLRAKDWLPLTVTALGWQGQSFDNSRRV